jgi:hypothetical protein
LVLVVLGMGEVWCVDWDLETEGEANLFYHKAIMQYELQRQHNILLNQVWVIY